MIPFTPTRTHTRRSPGRRLAATIVAAALIAGAALVLPQVAIRAAAAGLFDCSIVYSLASPSGTNGSVIRQINQNTGEVSNVSNLSGFLGNTPNALGISDDGRYAYFATMSGNARYVNKWDQTTDRFVWNLRANDNTSITHGAINPANGIFYYGGITNVRANLRLGTLNIWAFTQNGENLGLVASGLVPSEYGVNANGNGDFDFDAQGHAYVVGADQDGNARLSVLNEPLPTTRQSTPQVITAKEIAAGNLGGVINGIGFHSDGYLYAADANRIYQINAATGRNLGGKNLTRDGRNVDGSADLGSCGSPGSVTLSKSFTGDRDQSNDQATVEISTEDATASGTTFGTSPGRQDDPSEQAGPMLVRAGQTVNITETGSGADTSRYSSAWECLDLNTDSVLAFGSGTNGTFTMPSVVDGLGAAVDCTFFNASSRSGISVVKRAVLDDQNENALADAGERINYTFTVSNTGRVPLTDVSISDDLVSDVSPASVDLLPEGESTEFTASYTVTQDDIDAGKDITNIASALGTTPTHEVIESETSTTTTPVPAAVTGLSLDKEAVIDGDTDGDGAADAGETVKYTFTVTNTGNTTLTDVTIADDRVESVDPERVASLAPGRSAEFTAEYLVTQADVDAGLDLVNVATAHAEDPRGAAVQSRQARANVPVAAAVSSLSLDKDARLNETAVNGVADVDETVTYSFTVTNTGNQTLRDVTIADDRVTAISPESVPELAPGESATFTADYTVTQADVDRGFDILNTASASGESPAGTTVDSNDATANTPVAPRVNRLGIVKQDRLDDPNGNNVGDADEVITYTFTVTNTGNTTLTDVRVIDERVTSVSPEVVDSLAPGEQAEFTASYTITQDDVDSGEDIRNTATGAGITPSRDFVVSGPSSTVTPIATTVPDLSIDKVGTLVDTNNNGAGDLGERVTYEFTVTNTGNATLTNVTVADDRVASVDPASVASLAPQESVTFSAEYIITQADMDGDTDLLNVATALGDDPAGERLESDEAIANVPLSPQVNGLAIVKDSSIDDGSNIAEAGDTITYEFVITNTGNTSLTGVVVNDPRFPELTETPVTLAPNESTTVTAEYVVTQADVDAGNDIVNTATASGTSPASEAVASGPSSTVTPVATAAAGLAIVKANELVDSNDNGVADVDEVIRYSFAVRNTGNVTLTDVTVSDDRVTGTDPASIASLAPGELATFTAEYVVTQADVDGGEDIVNVAAAHGADPGGEAVTSLHSETVTPVAERAPKLTLEKQATVDDGDHMLLVGDTVTYEFIATNSGNTTLHDVRISDDRVDSVAPESVADLAPGDTARFTASYTVTQADVDAEGDLVNVATAAATAPGESEPVVSNPGRANLPIAPQDPHLELVKRAELHDSNGNATADAGERISYTITATNTGNVTLTDVRAADALVPVTPESVASLAPGETAEFTGSYSVTQEDVDRGAPILNTAVGSGTPPAPDGEDAEPISSDQTSAETPVTPSAPALDLVKSAALQDTNANRAADPGETISYSFDVTNTGNVTMDGVFIDDDRVDTVTPDRFDGLAPGETTSFTAEYTVTQDDIDANGAIVNVATARGWATGTDQSEETDPVSSGPDSATVPVVAFAPGLSVVKSSELGDTNENRVADTGEVISYAFTVTNTGTVTLTDVSVTDERVTDLAPASVAILPPGATADFTASYTLTQADVDAGEDIVNVATASATDPEGEPVAAEESETTVPVASATPALSLEKTAELGEDAGTTASVGDLIVYTFTVTNTGNITLTDITIDDDRVDAVDPSSVATLAPNGQATFTAEYTVTQADVDAGGDIVNVATARSTVAEGEALASNSSRANIPSAAGAPGLTLSKAAALDDSNRNSAADAGERIDYTVTVTNTGNVTLTDVTVDDPLVTLSPDRVAELGPGASAELRGSYTVTQSDVDAGDDIVNTATATGTGPDGESLTSDPGSTRTPIAGANPGLSLVKVGTLGDNNSNAAADVGEIITYTFTATNTGNVTLTDVTVNDDRVNDLTPESVATLAPGETAEFTATYTVTQADVDTGADVVNTATATGTSPAGDALTSAASTAQTPVAATAPGLTLLKEAALEDLNDNAAADVGEIITYTFTATNTGNVTLTDVTVNDDKVSDLTPATVATLAPGETAEFTATYTVTQADVDTGADVVNTATATGTSPAGDALTSAASTAITPIAEAPEPPVTPVDPEPEPKPEPRPKPVPPPTPQPGTPGLPITGATDPALLFTTGALLLLMSGGAGALALRQRRRNRSSYSSSNYSSSHR